MVGSSPYPLESVTLDDLIEQSCVAASADLAWLGSDAHLTLLNGALEPVFGLSNASLEWAPPGGRGFWEQATRQMRVERPSSVSGFRDSEVAKLTVLSLLHECLHARYSTSFGSFETKKQALDPRLWPATERLLNVFEDGRIGAIGGAADPGLTSHLAEFADLAVEQAARRAGSSGPGATPASQRNQLFFAVEAYALWPDSPPSLNPDVRQVLEQLAPLIESTRNGTTEDCGVTAVQVVQAIMASSLSS